MADPLLHEGLTAKHKPSPDLAMLFSPTSPVPAHAHRTYLSSGHRWNVTPEIEGFMTHIIMLTLQVS